MDKLGVVTDETLSKEASGEPRRMCPSCGEELLPREGSNVSRCPKCGTKPFESADGKG